MTFLLPGGSSLLNSLPQLSFGSVYMKMWQALTALDNDPFPSVAQLSRTITDHIRDQVRGLFSAL